VFAAENPERLLRLGFKLGRGSVHAARTMMLPELRRVLDAVPAPGGQDEYRVAGVDRNVLDKVTALARKLTFEHLSDLYVLDPDVCLHRVFRRLSPSSPHWAMIGPMADNLGASVINPIELPPGSSVAGISGEAAMRSQGFQP
jgi:hypothetical protein